MPMRLKARDAGLVAAGLAVAVVAGAIVLRLYCVLGDTKTTILLVRHAERNDSPDDNFAHPDGSRGPTLTDDGTDADGMSRAAVLAHVAGEAGVAAIYHTEFLRTRQTVTPLDDLLPNNATHLFEAHRTNDLVEHVLANYRGQVVVIASHSNRVPEIIARLGGPQLPDIPGGDFDNLFVITVSCRDPPKVLLIKYGRPT